MVLTKEQLSELICKHSERENGLQDTAFSFKKYCSSLVIVVKMLIFVHSDAEAPP